MKRLLVFVFAIMPLLAFATDEICPAGYYPAEYVELEYIESTGTQYIDTGFKPNQDTSIEIEYNLTKLEQSVSSATMLFGARNSALSEDAASGIFRTLTWTINKVAFGQGQGTNKYLVGTIGQIVGVNYIIKYNKNNVYYDGVLNTTIPKKTPIWSSLLNIYLFAVNTNGNMQYPCKAKIYYTKIWDDNELVRDFIPVRRAFDGAVGMFDRVEGKFYGNDGTGEFIAGPEKTGASFIADENGDITCVSCPANTYKPNAGNTECTKCPEHTFSPVGSTSLSDCAKILRVKDYVVYMPLGKRTEHGLCVMSDGKKYCADVYERQ